MEKPVKPRGHQPGSDVSGKLFDTIMQRHGFTRDAQLANYFGLARSSVSRVRNGTGTVSQGMRLTIIQKEGFSVEQIDKLIKQPRFKVTAQQQEGA